MTNRSGAQSYDEFPYPNLTYTYTHPDRLATLATLLGMKPAPVEECSVLDIGCAGGGNIIPMAHALPNSTFVGIDYAGRQIKDGKALVADLGLSNLTLEHMDIMEMPDDFGEFDYIVAHGLYSWVPAPVRDRLLTVIRRHLKPQGVAYVSFNALPGWHMIQIVRGMMKYHTRNIVEPYEKARRSREIIQFICEALEDEPSAFSFFLKDYMETLDKKTTEVMHGGLSLLLHDELEEINDPVYFYQFVEHIKQHELQYLVEAELALVLPFRLKPEVGEKLEKMSTDIIEMEQYLDFVNNRMFRHVLLCHEEVDFDRTIRAEVVSKFHVATRAKPVSKRFKLKTKSVEKFRGKDGAVFSTNHPLSKAALLFLAQNTPMTVSFDQVIQEAAKLLELPEGVNLEEESLTVAANILRAYGYSSSLIELHLHAPTFSTVISERPVASQMARWQQAKGIRINNLRHERIELGKKADYILSHLDGHHTADDLLEGLLELYYQGEISLAKKPKKKKQSKAATRRMMAREVYDNLQFMARAALLEA
jgi:methyltransferase-like protein/ubiquinone/menaquinone biosynthesis C-methylase UbiE